MVTLTLKDKLVRIVIIAALWIALTGALASDNEDAFREAFPPGAGCAVIGK